MDLNLKDKVAIVTGSGGQTGFGKAIALTLAREGCDIVVADLDLEGAKKTAAEIEALGRKPLAVKVDITKVAEVNNMVKTVLDKFGKIDILVNNAGASGQPKPFIEKTQEDMAFDINVNLWGPLNCTKAVLGHMISRESGKIVFVSSSTAVGGIANTSVYTAAKGGIVSFTRALAREVTHLGINVNSVAPGLARTNFVAGAPDEFMHAIESQVWLGRLTEPQDIANAVVFLASDASIDIVGQIILVNGGGVYTR
jgi:NAD(P)-dependent dehydrogenase (short-subunit alcohol dehydrogenase family)